jgi:hypothetical protein
MAAAQGLAATGVVPDAPTSGAINSLTRAEIKLM